VQGGGKGSFFAGSHGLHTLIFLLPSWVGMRGGGDDAAARMIEAEKRKGWAAGTDCDPEGTGSAHGGATAVAAQREGKALARQDAERRMG